MLSILKNKALLHSLSFSFTPSFLKKKKSFFFSSIRDSPLFICLSLFYQALIQKKKTSYRTIEAGVLKKIFHVKTKTVRWSFPNECE
jgi:hypothetical protein